MTRALGSGHAEPGDARGVVSNLHVLRPAAAWAKARSPEPFASGLRPDQEALGTPVPWDRLVVWLIAGALGVLLTFAALATFFDFASWGVAAQGVTIVALMVAVAIINWLILRPLLSLSRVASRVLAGDYSSRILPAGSSEVRVLGLTLKALLDRLADVTTQGVAGASAARLSVAATQHAAAISEQTGTAAVTSAGMEALAMSSASIAEAVSELAASATKLRENIQRARTDLQASSDRTLANAKRVTEIQGVLELINDIADQTSLLALNAAIEAARAGDAGRGFAIVADEVRRMAERSKAAAAQIAKLAEGAQSTSAEAVLAIDKRGRQLDDWMSMTKALAEKSDEVRPAAKRHQADTDVAQNAMQLIAEGLRSNAIQASQIAAAASDEAGIATQMSESRPEGQR